MLKAHFMADLENKRSFIRRQSEEIKPLLGIDEQDLLFADNEMSANSVLERYRDKLFSKENPAANPDAKRILFTANNPGGYNAMRPLISALEEDPRCKETVALVSGIARKNLEADKSSGLKEVEGNSPMVMQEVLKFSQQKPVDVVIATVSSFNGPEALVLYGGKSSLGAKKIFFIAEAWGGLGSSFNRAERGKMDHIDGIFCADEVAKRIFRRQLPDLPEDLFVVTGSPVIDSLRVENPEAFTREARNKLNISDSAVAIAYLGDISDELKKAYGCDGTANEKTFDQTLQNIAHQAKSNPDQDYVLMVRPHPRDPNKEKLIAAAESMKLPNNLKVITASSEVASIQEVRYAANAILSIASTENFLAPRLGKTAIFLGYKQGNLGSNVLEHVYGQKLMGEIASADPNIHVASSAEETANILKNIRPPGLKAHPDSQTTSAVENIKNRVLS